MSAYDDEGPMEDPGLSRVQVRRPDRDRRTAGDYLDLCMKGAAELEAAVDSLSERLSTVLRPERPSPSRDLASATEDQSALSDHLDRHARGLADLAGRLRDLAARVDL